MKIGIQTWGTDGDILPFLALARGLRASGHEVSLVYTSVDNKDYSRFARDFDITVRRAFEKFSTEHDREFADIVRERDPLKELTLVMQIFFEPAIDDMFAAAETLCLENDLIIHHFIHYPAVAAADKHKKPRVVVALNPMTIESRYVSPMGPSLGTWLNPLLWKLADGMVRKKIFLPADRLRLRQGLAPIANLQQDQYITDLTLIALSRVLYPRLPDWADTIQICGFLNPPLADAGQALPRDLQDFIAAGAPPVYYTFGSCIQFDIPGSTRLFLDTVKQTGMRAIIQSLWHELPNIPEDPDIFRLTSIPHDLVFPHCAAIVHHGGAGTTQSSLKAGVPSVVVPHGLDQAFWAKQLQKIGVAGKLLHRGSATPARLAQAIKAVAGSQQMRQKAQDAAAAMRGEDGVAAAVALINKRFAHLAGSSA